MSMRVYELAKKLGIENRDLLPELKKMGVSVASHSSALDQSVVQKVLEKLAPKNKAAGETGHAVRSGVTKVPSVEEPAKPDKRRILIKRKKEDEPAEAVFQAPPE